MKHHHRSLRALVIASLAAGLLSAVPRAGSALADGADRFTVTEIAQFTSPWAMTFLPDGRLLVTEMAGTLHLYDPASKRTGNISGVPDVVRVAQGGLGDVVLHPNFKYKTYKRHVESRSPR